MYGSKRRKSRNVLSRLRECVRISKNFYYESPCGVTGTAQHTGSEGHLRADEQIGISERGKTETQSLLQAVKCWIGKCYKAYNNPLFG
jgi:hypothetical protein